MAEDVVKVSPIIFFDEFQVTDIANAMLLGRLFEYELGPCIPISWYPERCGLEEPLSSPQVIDLPKIYIWYRNNHKLLLSRVELQDGLQRHLFLPTIDAIVDRNVIFLIVPDIVCIDP